MSREKAHNLLSKVATTRGGDRLLAFLKILVKTHIKHMSIPKRVPWATLAELDELCAWIYSDNSDITRKQLAKNRVCK